MPCNRISGEDPCLIVIGTNGRSEGSNPMWDDWVVGGAGARSLTACIEMSPVGMTEVGRASMSDIDSGYLISSNNKYNLSNWQSDIFRILLEGMT